MVNRNDLSEEERLTELAKEVVAEQIRATEKGYGFAHDHSHGVQHLLDYAHGYLDDAALGDGSIDRQRVVKAAGLLFAAIDLLDWQEGN